MASAPLTSARAIGSIDEGGYLNGIHRRGYTHPKSLLEIVANILDALDEIQNAPSTFSPFGYFDIQRETIRILDNGVGMNESDAVDMFALHRENNGKRKKKTSRGVSGIGAKAAICILSGKTTVHLYTRKVGSEYLHITVPWEEIFRTKTYTGMVRVEPMTETEKKAFIRDRATRGMLYGSEAQGTTIVFSYNDKLSDVINENFKKIRESDLTNPLDRIDFVFGKDKVDFALKHYEKDEVVGLELYNYFHGSQSNFYTGVKVETIQMYRMGDEDRFIWCRRDQQLEICGNLKLSKQPGEMKRSLNGWRHVGDIEVTAGMRVDLSIFNPANPAPLTGARKVDSYCKEFLCDDDNTYDKEAEEYVLNHKLVRNDQTIGLIPPELVKVGNARANGESRLKIEYVQCEAAFYPTSTQDNPLDRAFNTQENKNQLNGNSISKRLTRLIEAIKQKKAEQIWRYMQDLLRTAESEEDSDEEDEEDADSESESESEDEAPPPLPPAPVDGGSGAAGGGAPVVVPEEDDHDDGNDFSPLLVSPLLPPEEPPLNGADVYKELIRVASSMDRDAALTDLKWFNLLRALREC